MLTSPLGQGSVLETMKVQVNDRVGRLPPAINGLSESAWAASRTKGTYLQARYHRLASQRGRKRATMAVAHTLLIIAYHIVKERCTYNELGADYFDQLNGQYLVKRFTSRIETLGYHVTLQKEETLPA